MWRKLIVKIIGNGIFTVPLLLWFGENTTLAGALAASLTLSIIAYVVGDQMILRATNNGIATVADALLAFFVLWLIAFYANWMLSFTELCVISIVLGVVEFFYHRYLLSGYRDRV